MARRAAEPKAEPRSARIPRLGPDPKKNKALAKVGASFSLWRPAPQVLLNVEAVPTFFPQVNRVSRVGGWPLARVAVVHGPSSEGKTALCIGLEGSFLARGHFVGHIDAEQTTPISWIDQLLGEYARGSGFFALRPRSYEEARDAAREFCDTIVQARASGDVDDATSGIIVVDSIRKLVPQNLLKELLKATAADAEDEEKEAKKGRFAKKPKGIDGAGGRAGQIKAQINAAWLDELVPMLGQSRCTAVIVARESEVAGEGFFSQPQIKIGGGSALYFDSSLVVRVTRDAFLYESTDKGASMVGERHAVEVHKTKVAGRDERWPTAYFNTSNGRQCPAGFDRTRDVFDLATEIGVVETNKSWFSFDGENIGNGINATLKLLRNKPELLTKIEEAIAEHEAKAAPAAVVPVDAPRDATAS